MSNYKSDWEEKVKLYVLLSVMARTTTPEGEEQFPPDISVKNLQLPCDLVEAIHSCLNNETPSDEFNNHFFAAWVDDFGNNGLDPRAVVIATSLEEQRIAVNALRKSACPIYGCSVDDSNLTEEQYQRTLFVERLLAFQALPYAEQEKRKRQNGEPRPGFRTFPSKIPLFSDPRFMTFRKGRGYPHGPICRFISVATVEGFVAVFNFCMVCNEDRLADEFVNFMLDPGCTKLFFNLPAAVGAMANTFEQLQIPRIISQALCLARPTEIKSDGSTSSHR